MRKGSGILKRSSARETPISPKNLLAAGTPKVPQHNGGVNKESPNTNIGDGRANTRFESHEEENGVGVHDPTETAAKATTTNLQEISLLHSSAPNSPRDTTSKKQEPLTYLRTVQTITPEGHRNASNSAEKRAKMISTTAYNWKTKKDQ